MRQYSCIQFVRFFFNLSAATQWTCSQVLDGKESTRFYIDPFHEYSKPKEITALSSPSLYNIISKIRWVLPGQGNLRSESHSSFNISEKTLDEHLCLPIPICCRWKVEHSIWQMMTQGGLSKK